MTLLAEAVVAAFRLFATDGVEATVFRLAGAIVLAPAPEALTDCFCCCLVDVCLAVDAAVGLAAEDGTPGCCLRIDFGFVIAEICFVFVAALLLLKRVVDAGPLSPSSESESTSPSK